MSDFPITEATTVKRRAEEVERAMAATATGSAPRRRMSSLVIHRVFEPDQGAIVEALAILMARSNAQTTNEGRQGVGR